MDTVTSYNGVFIPDDLEATGHLAVNESATVLRLVSPNSLSFGKGFFDIHGRAADGTKLSLLHCISQGHQPHNEELIFPHFIVFGRDFVHSDKPVIQSVVYQIENGNAVAGVHNSFQTLLPPKNEILAILKAEYERNKEIKAKYGWDIDPFDPFIGEAAMLHFYDGRSEIIKCSTSIGNVSLQNQMSAGHGGASGVGFDNKIAIAFEFDAPLNIHDTILRLRRLHALFELVLGRWQRYSKILLNIQHAETLNDDDHAYPLELAWSYCNERVKSAPKETHIGDILLDPGRRPEEFKKVVSSWLDTDAEMREPRERFANCFGSSSINQDRIIAAANMFDLLPADKVPADVPVDAELEELIKETKAKFKSLPAGIIRNSVRDALGRTGKPTLPQKVLHRASIVQGACKGRFPDLDIPCREAVRCRNRYVHGSNESFDYVQNIEIVSFLTETLEFVFAASDLIEIGWDFRGWCEQGAWHSHPFGRYIYNYENYLTELKKLLEKPET